MGYDKPVAPPTATRKPDKRHKHKIFNMAVFGPPKEKEGKKEAKAIFKEIIA